jgi:DNA-binding transcriptional LysR family regulator
MGPRRSRYNAPTIASICYIFDPMDQPLETSELLAFARTVDSKSLSRAAAELGVPRATIGRRLARLEERLGTRLLRRTTRSLALTDAGAALYRHARIVLEALASAEASVRRSDDVVRGDLRVSVPPMLNASFFNMLCTYAERFPEVRLHVHSTTQHADLLRDGYDVAIRATSELEPGLTARTLARMPLLAVASPAYLAAHGTPRTHRELREHRCLMGFARGETPQTHWPFPAGGKLHVEGAFFSNEVPLLLDAALRGLGIALLPLLVVYEALQAGRLVHVLDGVIGADSRVAVVFLEREFVPPHVRAFVDAVVAWAPAELGRPVPQCNTASKRAARTKRPRKRARAAG